MQMALELAAKAKGRTSPNPMVGAVMVKDGQIVGQGYHAKAGTPHAEVHALREAGEAARGATVYVTLEPCSHFGRTPPCTEALIKAGVKRVVAAMVDPNPLVAGTGLARLREAGIETEVGVLEGEARQLNEIFIKYITTKSPFVLFKTAMTLDGKIATATGQSKWVTGPTARRLVHQLRNTYDAVMVGIGTLLADDPALTTRIPGEETQDPVRIVVDSLARTPLEAKVINQESAAKTIIIVGEAAPKEKVAALEQRGAEVLLVPCGIDGRPDIKTMLERLGRAGITSILLEGGSQLAGSFFKARMVDKVSWFVAPKIIGGNDSPGPVDALGILHMEKAITIDRITAQPVGEDFHLEGYPVYRK